MDEYISREEAKKFFNQNFGSVSHAVIASRLLDEIPAADVVPVVRCFECKHSDNECHRDGLRYCMRGIKADDYNETGYIYPLEVIVRDDDFCSYGERKDSDE